MSVVCTSASKDAWPAPLPGSHSVEMCAIVRDSMASPQKIEFFFDVGSPYSYLAATQMSGVSERTGLAVVWRPFLVGGVFKAAGNTMPAAVAAKGRWMVGDLALGARRYGVPFRMSSRFPLNTLTTQRAIVGATRHLGPSATARLALSLFSAYWVDDRDVSSVEEISSISDGAGLDASVVVSAMGEQETKDALREATDEAVARGAFGAPTLFVGDRMYWGHDRLELLEWELAH